ncbi:GGDEF domain-containing protein [Actinoplanes couchii]|uniref:Diguanylate cyclase with PAS/PAC sensor n=1 Tax=Actinoplanes couchii TaxID=403638 RepID=A0ABQ3XJ31_9ACTN|nr:GGDEF domain-containing protein [Actinoplanes couchii]MDR6324510.1 diguanylate cyclase (GGDEF)-like protein/PAS domain S-box-containing protein [Actinoplanes couchii]GID58490.1 hypothetical protein Aco03nite_068940 [Actinoplanes couchii]
MGSSGPTGSGRFRLSGIADDYDAEYWSRQIRFGGVTACIITTIGASRVATVWDGDNRWWVAALVAAVVLQMLLSALSWKRLVRRPLVREALVTWWVVEIPVLTAFCLIDDAGATLYPPGAILVVTTAAALYPPTWVLLLGILSLVGFAVLEASTKLHTASFIGGLCALLLAVIGLSVLTAANRWRQDGQRRAAERRVGLLLQNASDVILAANADGRICYTAGSAQGLLGLPPGQLIGTPLASLAYQQDQELLTHWLAAAATSRSGTCRVEVRMVRPDGTWLPVEILATRQHEDPVLGDLVLNIRDLSHHWQERHQLAQRALTDALTGLGNRASFDNHLSRAIDRLHPDGGDVAVLLMDLDGFKPINDTWGHAVGDQVLTTIATRLRTTSRPHDTLARIGGDEFALILTGVPDDEVMDLARRLESAVCQPINISGSSVGCGISIGLAVARTGDQDISAQQLTALADQAMYAVKRSVGVRR